MAESRFSILSEEFAAAPERHFGRLREHAPVHHEPALDAWFLSRHRDVRRVLTDHEAFGTGLLQVRAEPVMGGPVLVQMTGAEHTAKRGIVVRAFTGPALREQVRTLRANAVELLAPLLARGRMDLVNEFGKPFAVRAALDVLGLDREDWRRVAERTAGVGEFVTAVTLTEERRRVCLELAGELEAQLAPIVEQRRLHPGADLISTLCTAEFDGVAMSTREVVALIVNVLVAAVEPADKTLHQCVGAAFARAEIETVAALLLPLLEDVRFTPGSSYRETGLYTRGPVALSLDFAPVPTPATLPSHH
ncbi:hypothetical protein [Kitasatospora purpeofusca]|uniref:hypothetical protein n=1 Tax=Kitasatospora purpeofusca TaxID=67352 RepID=UPI003863326C|nr:hypothetical protein OIP63_31890 [Kitasatospora purpeofusca]